jgi:hypothetical protein
MCAQVMVCVLTVTWLEKVLNRSGLVHSLLQEEIGSDRL